MVNRTCLIFAYPDARDLSLRAAQQHQIKIPAAGRCDADSGECLHRVPDPVCTQDDALLATDDKRQHALPSDGKCHVHAFPHQPDGFFYDLIVFHRVIVS